MGLGPKLLGADTILPNVFLRPHFDLLDHTEKLLTMGPTPGLETTHKFRNFYFRVLVHLASDVVDS